MSTNQISALITPQRVALYRDTIAGCSRFLSEELLRHPDWLTEIDDIESVLSREDYRARLERRPLEPALFRRRELVRIVLRDRLGLASLAEVTEEISNLADAILECALAQHSGFTVLALGKLGGRELNYSSDIDLMFLCGEGDKLFYNKVAVDYVKQLSTCYRVDLRLRPEGTLGEICIPLAAAKEYYAKRARDWELQMLIKARVCVGDERMGRELLEFVEPLIYSTTVDFSAIETMSATRERISEKLAQRRLKSDQTDVKLGRGGIRDVEFLVQCLQRLHGARETELRHGGTLQALSRLYDGDLLSSTEHSRLGRAYEYFRRLEHLLQLEDDRQTHALPLKAQERERLAQRMGVADAAQLLRELSQHMENVQTIYERIVYAQRPLRYRDAQPTALVTDWTRQVSEMSPYLADQLTRHPELQEEIRRASEHPTRRWAFEGLAAPLTDTGALRRFFRREMFRILVTSVCMPEYVFTTLDNTSALAEFVVARAYRIALERGLAHAAAHSTMDKPFEEPQDEMMVVAVGRLGMREFDFASDADLLFIIPDSEAKRHPFWTRVAEHVIEILTAYTADGTILSIDTRLRPNGREGLLVQTESKYVDYFSTSAAAWEGIAYMKARAVAGDTERATSFLNQLQQVDWRRYGQSGRSKQDLYQMRLRLQREQGSVSPLKAAEGGYYDADFILMYLRLKGAGMFYKSLNTPERIDIVEKMGHLDRADAEFLLLATTYFRALDHAIRVVKGRAEKKIPVELRYREKIAELMPRWTGHMNHAGKLDSDLAAMQSRMRRVFEHVFN